MSKTSVNRRKFSPAKLAERRKRFMPGEIPRYVRCYDNEGASIDRYTVVFTGRYGHLTGRETWILCMSGSPFHPQGFGQHAAMQDMQRPDAKGGKWGGPSIGQRCPLGVRICFEDLPEDCRKLVRRDYEYLWDLTAEEPPCGERPVEGPVV